MASPRSALRRLRESALAVVTVFAASACDEPGPRRPEVDFTAFDQAVDAYLARNGYEGATAAVVHRDFGVLHVRGYGAFDADRVVLLASSSKVLSAGVLMRLADQGLLDVDAPVSDYLGEYGAFKTDVTVAQMMSNSAGMVGLIENAVYAPYICQYLPSASLSSCAVEIYTADDAAEREPPDTRYRYGGGQWQLAGGVAERVSGKTFDQLVDETYVRPCGLGVLGYGNYFVKTIQIGGDDLGSLLYPDFFHGDVGTLGETDNPNLEGGAYTDARDYAKVLLMHLRGGRCGSHRVLSEGAVARMREDRIGDVYGGSTDNPALPGYGFGWWVSRTQPGVVADPGAFGTEPWIDFERGYAAVVMLEADGNSAPSVREATQGALEAAFDALRTRE